MNMMKSFRFLSFILFAAACLSCVEREALTLHARTFKKGRRGADALVRGASKAASKLTEKRGRFRGRLKSETSSQNSLTTTASQSDLLNPKRITQPPSFSFNMNPKLWADVRAETGYWAPIGFQFADNEYDAQKDRLRAALKEDAEVEAIRGGPPVGTWEDEL